MWKIFLTCVLLTERISSQDISDECPEKNGYYADSLQCDRYYECKDGQLYDRLCPDGLVFDESSIQFAKCAFPFSVDCSDRTELQETKAPTPQCPRQNGYYPHEDPRVCDKFYFCVDGVANPISCPSSLIFDPTKGQCAYSDQVHREGCSSQEVFQFDCPGGDGTPHEHPRFPDPDDCQFFYICIGGTSPRRNGCTTGTVFNTETLACDQPENVNDDCRDWYNSTFLESLEAKKSQEARHKITNLSGRKRVKIIRKNQGANVRQQQNNHPPSPGFEQAVDNRRPHSDQPQARPQNTRSRVRNRFTTSSPSQPAAEDEPLAFALEDPDSIQQFRNHHGFTSQDSRLTVLNKPQQPGNPQGADFPFEKREPEPQEGPFPPPPPHHSARNQRPGGFSRRRPAELRRPQPAEHQGDDEKSHEFSSFEPRF